MSPWRSLCALGFKRKGPGSIPGTGNLNWLTRRWNMHNVKTDYSIYNAILFLFITRWCWLPR